MGTIRSINISNTNNNKMKLAILSLIIASASAFAPLSSPRVSTSLNLSYGEFDAQTARSVLNFNPFETFEGNSPDASGYYPGETGYKDPARGDVSYASMQVERAEIEERLANP